jgi:hypothetical protein
VYNVDIMSNAGRRAFQHTLLILFTVFAVFGIVWGIYSFVVVPFNAEDKTAAVISATKSDRGYEIFAGENTGVVVSLPLVGGATAQHWKASSANTMLHTLVSENVCDGNKTYLTAPTQANTKALFPVSLSFIPDGAQIVGVEILPCVGMTGSVVSEAEAFYRILDKDTMVEGRGDGLVLAANDAAIRERKPSIISIPHIFKTASTTLSVGLEVVRNGGGVQLSHLGVRVAYLQELASPEDIRASLQFATTSDNLVELVALLNWNDKEVGEDGYMVELLEKTKEGLILTPWRPVGVLYKDSQTFSYPFVSDGKVTETYNPNSVYEFRIQAFRGDRVSVAKTASVSVPEELTVLSPTDAKATYSRESGRVMVTWIDQLPQSATRRFEIYRANEKDLVWIKVGETDGAVSFPDHGPMTSGNYFYKVRTLVPYEGGGYLVSDFSNEASVEVLNDLD